LHTCPTFPYLVLFSALTLTQFIYLSTFYLPLDAARDIDIDTPRSSLPPLWRQYAPPPAIPCDPRVFPHAILNVDQLMDSLHFYVRAGGFPRFSN
jgi:hypothetical protein